MAMEIAGMGLVYADVESTKGHIPRCSAAKFQSLQSESGLREQICSHTPSPCGGVLD